MAAAAKRAPAEAAPTATAEEGPGLKLAAVAEEAARGDEMEAPPTRPQGPELTRSILSALFLSAHRGDDEAQNDFAIALDRAARDVPPGARKVLRQSGICDVARGAASALVMAAYGKSLEDDTAAEAQIAAVRAELAGPDPSPLEAVLAERAALAWFAVNFHEATAVRAGSMTIAQADHEQRRLSRANARFLDAIKAIAVVRKLQAPATSPLDGGVRVQSNVAVTVNTGGESA